MHDAYTRFNELPKELGVAKLFHVILSYRTYMHHVIACSQFILAMFVLQRFCGYSYPG